MRRSAQGGFTLIEILLVIALFGMVAGLVLIQFTPALEALESKSPRQLLQLTILEARMLAREENKVLQLRYDKEANALVLMAGEATLFTEPFEQAIDKLEFRVRHAVEWEAARVGEGWAEDPAPYLVFTPEGLSSAVRIAMETEVAETYWELDPLSASLMPYEP